MSASRSSLIGVQVVSNSKGHFVSVYMDGRMNRSLGPLDSLPSIPEALNLVAAVLRMEHADRSPQ